MRTVAGLTDDREHFEHLLHKVFAPWLGRPAVQAELEKVLASRPKHALTWRGWRPNSPRWGSKRDSTARAVCGCGLWTGKAFGAATVWQGELQPVALTNSVARIEAQVRALFPLDLDVTLPRALSERGAGRLRPAAADGRRHEERAAARLAARLCQPAHRPTANA